MLEFELLGSFMSLLGPAFFSLSATEVVIVTLIVLGFYSL